MKKLLFIFLFLTTCHGVNTAQDQAQKSIKEQLDDVQSHINSNRDTLSSLVTHTKELAKKKIIYRTITILQHDTAWRVDTCTTVFRPIDSATIAIMFNQPDIQKQIKVGKRIKIVILKRRHRD